MSSRSGLLWLILSVLKVMLMVCCVYDDNTHTDTRAAEKRRYSAGRFRRFWKLSSWAAEKLPMTNQR